MTHAAYDPTTVPPPAPRPVDPGPAYELFLSRLTAKARAAMVRHDEALANNPNAPAHARDTWRRLAVILAVLAPAPPDTLGKQALRFYIPDGKYRQQVFALEETKTAVLVYLPDVLAAALDKNILEKSDHEHVYVVAGHPDASLRIEVLAADTPDVTTAKPMLGWGRRALRVTLGPLTGEKHLTAVENLLALAAEGFPPPAA